jgi:putative phosphoesterase
MKIALLADVHANLPALEAVLKHARNAGVEEYWNLGDFVGYGAYPDEVVKKLNKLKALSVIGNYDRKVLKVEEKSEAWQKKKHPLKYLSFRWTHDQLSPESLAYLADLPLEQRVTHGGKKILLVHGSPDSIKEHLDSETPEKRLRELAKNAKADVIVCGHSHRPFFREAGTAYFINPGSVGRSEQRDARASYAILQIKTGSFQIQHVRIEYNLERAVAGLEKNKLPAEFIAMIRQGRTLNEVIADPHGGDDPALAARESEAQLEAILELAKQSAYDADHSHQVARIALMLFDQLIPLHGLTARERFLLECGAILHDIGWAAGQEGHNKTSYNMILDQDLPFPDADKQIIALLARYHRKAPPDPADRELKGLGDQQIKTVRDLAAIIRFADGLDRSHENLVQELALQISPETFTVTCRVTASPDDELRAARKKSDFLCAHFNRTLNLKFKEIRRSPHRHPLALSFRSAPGKTIPAVRLLHSLETRRTMMDQKIQTPDTVDRLKLYARRTADRLPLPVHYALSLAFLALLAGDIAIPDGIPFIDEALGAAGFYYYNSYILRRSLGRIKGLRTKGKIIEATATPVS